MRRILPFLIGLLGLFSGDAAGASFTFTRMADNSGELAYLGEPALNEAGMVAFWAAWDVGGEGLLASQGGAPRTLVDNSGEFAYLGAPTLNNDGTIAFWAAWDVGGESIFTSLGGVPIQIVGNGGDFDFLGLYPVLNEAGTVAFWAWLDDGRHGIFTGSGGAPIPMADDQGMLFYLWEPAFNNAGTVAFWAWLDDGREGVFTSQGGVPTRIADNSGDFSFLGFYPAINEAGTVAFWAWLAEGGEGLFIDQGGLRIPVADDNGGFAYFGDFALNNAGQVAFWARLDTGEHGIFTGADPVADKVIQVGDALDGSTVTALSFGLQGLNDPGQVAFFAGLADGREGVYRADPGTPAVMVDIKPGQWPNVIPLRSRGNLTVALLTTRIAAGEGVDFEAATVDLGSVRFGPAGAPESHGQGHFQDVDGDGDEDLVMHFRIPATGIAPGDTVATLTGQTVAGQGFQGSDAIITMPQ